MFGERLKRLRENNEMSKVKMGEILNMTASAYAFYETEKNSPSLNTLIKIAQFFDVSVDYLLGLTDIAEPHYVKLSPMQSDFINQFDTFTPEELEILEIYNNLNQNLKDNLYNYSDFCLQLEAKIRTKNVTTLNASKSHNTPHQEEQRQENLKSFHERTLYVQLKNEIKDKIKEKTNGQ